VSESIAARIRAPDNPDLAEDLAYLASSLEALSLEDGGEGARSAGRRDWIVRTIRQYLIPRIEQPAAPLIVVFAGPTGAGKSTLLNSITGQNHSPAGPLRPTTKEPVVLASEERADDYRHIGGVSCDVVTGRAPILQELILVDTPDIDSTSLDHRQMAETMIDNADVVVYVSSALRYSDLVPWEVLRRSQSRGVPLVQVLNRIRASSRGALADYTSMLRAGGLGADVVAVQEHHVDPGAQAISSPAIQELRDRLATVVEERRAGAADVVQTVFDTALELTREVIDVAASSVDHDVLRRSDVRQLLGVDLARIGSRREIGRGPGLDLGSLAEIGTRRLRTRRMIRRRAPSPAEVSRAIELFDEALIAAVDSDLRHQIHAGDLVHGEERKQLLSDTHLATRGAVDGWRGDLLELPSITASIDPPLVSLILGASCFEPPAPALTEVARLLASRLDLSGESAFAAGMLTERLQPVYAIAENRVNTRLSGAAATRRSIERVKAHRWAVIARSSFANA
jgi:energy-coupling factor transporter ATP-binding protein EcfA2